MKEILLHFVFSPFCLFLSPLFLPELFASTNGFPASFLKALSLYPSFLSFSLWYPTLLDCNSEFIFNIARDGWTWERVTHCCWMPRRAGCCRGTDPGAVLFFGQGQKFPVNLLKWEGGNWLVQLNPEAGGRRFTLASQSRTIRVHLTIVLPAPQGTLSFCYQTTELNYLKSQKMHFGEHLCEFCFAIWSPEGPMRTIALLCDSEHLPKHV